MRETIQIAARLIPESDSRANRDHNKRWLRDLIEAARAAKSRAEGSEVAKTANARGARSSPAKAGK